MQEAQVSKRRSVNAVADSVDGNEGGGVGVRRKPWIPAKLGEEKKSPTPFIH